MLRSLFYSVVDPSDSSLSQLLLWSMWRRNGRRIGCTSSIRKSLSKEWMQRQQYNYQRSNHHPSHRSLNLLDLLLLVLLMRAAPNSVSFQQLHRHPLRHPHRQHRIERSGRVQLPPLLPPLSTLLLALCLLVLSTLSVLSCVVGGNFHRRKKRHQCSSPKLEERHACINSVASKERRRSN